MPYSPQLCKRPRKFRAAALMLTFMLFAACWGLTPARAQVPYGFAQPYSPFVTIPWFQGEVRGTPIWMGVLGGTITVPSHGERWSLRNTFNMTKGHLFIDVMGRFQVGPVSLRVHGEQRDMVGTPSFLGQPGARKTEARLEFSGCRSGLDIDLFCRYGVRAGLNGDYYWYNPIITESARTNGGKKLLGENPLTVGIHASITIPRQFFGAWPVFEARVRWPVKIYTSPEITDLELVAGLKGPATVLGSLALRGGYRHTSLSFTDSHIYRGTPTESTIDAALGGWFGELVYYY